MAKRITKEKFAQIYGVSLRTWSRWSKDPKFPGGLDPSGVQQYVGTRKNRPKNMRPIDEVADLIAEEIGSVPDISEAENLTGIALEKFLKLRAERQLAEHKLEIARDEVMPKADHCAIVSELTELYLSAHEAGDEMIAELSEGKNAFEIIKIRAKEREEFKNELANAFAE